MADGTLLVWMDLEMSGLDAERERILEMATLVTTGELELIAEGPELVLHQDESLLARMDSWNTEHHGKSGLTDRVRASAVSEVSAEQKTLDFLKSVGVGARSAPLAGNSIHQDRLFVARYLPALDAHLHYRNVDVSTVKELVRRWMPAVFEARPTKRGSHRALDDIKESIEELRYYKRTAFR
jgi:oligoribonuclease